MKEKIEFLAVLGGDFELRPLRKRKLEVRGIDTSLPRGLYLDNSQLKFSSEDIEVNEYGVVTGNETGGMIKIELKDNSGVSTLVRVHKGRKKDILEMRSYELQEEKDYKLEQELYGKKRGLFGWLCNK